MYLPIVKLVIQEPLLLQSYCASAIKSDSTTYIYPSKTFKQFTRYAKIISQTAYNENTCGKSIDPRSAS
jgi:hypothetical protein